MIVGTAVAYIVMITVALQLLLTESQRHSSSFYCMESKTRLSCISKNTSWSPEVVAQAQQHLSFISKLVAQQQAELASSVGHSSTFFFTELNSGCHKHEN
jgi:hypothetical protein